jgi:hypothetical protein
MFVYTSKIPDVFLDPVVLALLLAGAIALRFGVFLCFRSAGQP